MSDQETIDQKFTKEDAEKIADLGFVIGRSFESIKRYGYPGRGWEQMLEQIPPYAGFFQPVIRQVVEELTSRPDKRGTYGLEQYLT